MQVRCAGTLCRYIVQVRCAGTLCRYVVQVRGASTWCRHVVQVRAGIDGSVKKNQINQGRALAVARVSGRKGVKPHIVHEGIDNNLLQPSDLTGHVDKEKCTTTTSTSTATSSTTSTTTSTIHTRTNQKDPKNIYKQHLKKRFSLSSK